MGLVGPQVKLLHHNPQLFLSFSCAMQLRALYIDPIETMKMLQARPLRIARTTAVQCHLALAGRGCEGVSVRGLGRD